MVQRSRRAVGQYPLAAKQKGRGQINSVTYASKPTGPLRVSRPGDHAILIDIDSRTYTVMFRQLRRLQHLDRTLAKQTNTISSIEHCAGLWRAIWGASGFAPSFGGWVQTFLSLDVGDISEALPPPAIVHALHESLLKYIRNFEHRIQLERLRKAREDRRTDCYRIFRDLKPQSSLPVQILISKQIATVQEWAVEDYAIVLTKPFVGDPTLPLLTVDQSFPIIHADDDTVWIDGLELLMPESQVWQFDFKGTLPELFDAFADKWMQRWGRHADQPPSRWHPVIDLAKKVFNHQKFDLPPLTGAELQKLALKKKLKAATGPDGLAGWDMHHCPLAWYNQLASLLTYIENGQPWPSQMTQGHITAIEKVENACAVGEFRPICVLPTTYRLWSSLRATQLLKALQRQAPALLFGSAPKKSATDMIITLQLNLEHANILDVPLAGIVVDLVKCFNTLPWCLVDVAEICGLPSYLAHAWKRSVAQLGHRFKIRGSIGEELKAATGFAEGDPLSVTAMFVGNLLADHFMTLACPSVRLWSYVDNLELEGRRAEDVCNGFTHLRAYCDLLDVSIDHKKTYAWANATLGRQTLKQADFNIKHSARDLGGHMCYTRRNTNQTITQKIDAMPELWSRLSRSLAPVNQKHRAIVSCAWLKGLHGIATVHLGSHQFDRLRAGAMKGTGASKKGASPIAYLSFCHSTRLDPECHAIFMSITHFRKYASPDVAALVFEAHHNKVRHSPVPEPYAVLFKRLQNIGWSWTQGVNFLDPFGFRHDLIAEARQSLYFCVKRSWFWSQGTRLQQRKSFEGMEGADPPFTVAKLHTWAVEERALLTRAMNGTFYTSNKLIHVGKVSNDSCRFCGQPDSSQHRYWDCPYFEDIKPAMSPDVAEFLQTAPPCTWNHGWICENPWRDEWLRTLATLPDTTRTYSISFHSKPRYWDIFTDGSMICPQDSSCRVATWGVVVGNFGNWHSHQEACFQVLEESSGTKFSYFPLACGFTPGIHQTVLRAELTAAISAIEWGTLTNTPVRLWVDNERVVKGIRAVLRSEPCPDEGNTDHDLWHRLWEAIKPPCHQQSSVIKVAAHQQLEHLAACDDIFAFHGNDQADQLAATTRKLPNADFWRLWEKHREAEKFRHKVRSEVQATILAMSLKAVKEKPEKSPVQRPGPAYTQDAPQSFVWTGPDTPEQQFRLEEGLDREV